MTLAGREDPSVRYVVGSLVAGVFFGGLGGGVAFPTLPTLGPLLILDRIGTRRPMIAGFVLQGLAPFGYILGLYADRLPVGSASVYDVAFAVAGAAGLLAAGVAFLVLPDVSPEVEASALRDLPGIVRADPRIAAVGTVNTVVRFLFAGVLLSTAVLYAESYDIAIGLFSPTGVSGIIMAGSYLTE